MPQIAINGLGRIGRAALKIIGDTPELGLVAINDIISLDTLTYLLKYDTVYGKYEKQIKNDGKDLFIDDRAIKVIDQLAQKTRRNCLGRSWEWKLFLSAPVILPAERMRSNTSKQALNT